MICNKDPEAWDTQGSTWWPTAPKHAPYLKRDDPVDITLVVGK